MKISFFTFGCTVNSAETQRIQDIFTEHGDDITEDDESDAVIINSCAITGSAEKNVLNLIARLKKKNAHRIIAVIGCYGELLLKHGKTAVPGVDILMGNEKLEIVNKIHHYYSSKNKGADIGFLTRRLPAMVSRLSGYVQVQNGCDNHCSYCIVPHLRGNSSSVRPLEIKAQLQSLAARGCREVILSGLNLGLYNQEHYDLIDILNMANDIDGIERIRLSSLEPMDVKSRFLNEFSKVDKLVKHLHISLQSGSNRILKQMNRNYNFEDYRNMIMTIRERTPGIAITTDIIVGFPGETDNDYLESMRNVILCEFSDIHIFKYSPRKGTPAALLPDQITEHKKTSRAAMLMGIKRQSKFNFNHGFVGKTVTASLFRHAGNLNWEGFTEHNIPVLVRAADVPANAKVKVNITGMDEAQEKLIGNISGQLPVVRSSAKC